MNKSFSRCSRTVVAAAAVAAFFIIAATVVSAAQITSITPKRGSILGGTRVTILGTGFDMRSRSNDVFVGTGLKGVFWTENVVPNEGTTSRIVALTEPMPTGDYPLSVRSFGFLATCQIASGCDFSYDAESTPEVTSVSPEWVASVPTPITVSGRRFSQGDPTVANFDFTLHLGEEERCDLLGQIAWDSFVCAVHSMRPGTLPMDLIHGAQGRAKWSTKNTLLVIPTVVAVSPADGSIAGGRVITITGTSFSPVPAENEVRVHGTLCPVLKFTGKQITCRTGAHTPGITSHTTNPWKKGEVFQEFWFNLAGNSIHQDWYTKLAYLNPHESTTVYGPNTIARSCEQCAVRTTFYFYAPTQGDYVFSGTCDDNLELWVSADETPVERKQEELAGVVLDVTPFHTRMVLSGYHGQQLEGTIKLTVGWKWVRIYLKQGNGGMYQTLSVTYPGTTTKVSFNDIPKDEFAYRAPYTPPVAVSVRGLAAMYAEPCLVDGACRFDYVLAKTAVVQSVTHTGSNVAAGTVITITGTNFDTASVKPAGAPPACFVSPTCGGGGCLCRTQKTCELYDDVCVWSSNKCLPSSATLQRCETWSRNTVTVCGIKCQVTLQTTTSLECVAGFGMPAGECNVEVNVEGSGRASSAATVNVIPIVTKIYPATGFVTGGNLLTIVGSGFDASLGATTVKIGGVDCPVLPGNDTVTFHRIICVVPSSGSATAQNVVVNVRGQQRAIARDVFAFDVRLERPGTSKVDIPPTIAPLRVSLSGEDRIVIALPGRPYPPDATVVVTFAGAYNCPVLSTNAGTIVCQAPQPGMQQKMAANVVVTAPARLGGGVLYNIDVPDKVDFNNIVTSTTRWINPDRRSRIHLYGKYQPARISDIAVTIAGQACDNIEFSRYWNYILCDAPVRALTPPVLPVIDTHSWAPAGFTNVLHSMVYSASVSSNGDGTVTIPAGEYLMTKKRYTRPFAFEAVVRPTKTVSQAGKKARIVIRFGFDDPTSTLGYHAAVGLDEFGAFGLGRDQPNRIGTIKEYVGSFSSIGVDPAAPLTLRVEAYNEAIVFFINEVEAGSIRDRNYLSGKIGFGFSDQQFTVGSYKVMNLKPRSTVVTFDGVEAEVRMDALYNARTPFTVTSMPIRSFTHGSSVTVYVERWLSNPFILALRNPDEQPTVHTPRLCYGNQFVTTTNTIKFNCTAQPLPAGTYYWLLSSSSDGAANTVSAAGAFVATVTEILPSKGSTAGGIITVNGYGFTRDTTVTIGDASCSTISQSDFTVTCRFGALAAGSPTVTVTTNGVAKTCSNADPLKCAFSIVAPPATPTVSGISPSSGALPRVITITGTNFLGGQASVYIGQGRNSVLCSTWSKSATQVIVFCGAQKGGNAQPVILHTATDNHVVSAGTFSVFYGVAEVIPSAGSAHGGGSITLRSNMLSAGAAGTVISSASSFAIGIASAASRAGWTNAPSGATVCSGWNLLGMMNYRPLHRTETGLAAHVAFKISFSMMWLDTDRMMTVQVDNKPPVTIQHTNSWRGNCRGGADSWTFISEGYVIVPHTSASAKISFSNGGSSSFWGLESYSVEILGAMNHVVTIGGQPCSSALSYVTPWETVCNSVPSGTVGTSGAVALTVGGTDMCISCGSFAYDAAATPVITSVADADLPGVRGVDTAMPQFATHDNIEATYANGKATVRRISGSDSWWNGWFFSPFAMNGADNSVIGVRGTIDGTHIMIGLTSRHNNEYHHGALDYALYFDNGRLHAMSHGAYETSLDYAAKGDEITIAHHSDCGCVRATLRPKNSIVAYQIHSWPLPPVFPLYVAGNAHNVGDGIKDMTLLHPRAQQSRRVVIFGMQFKEQPRLSVPRADDITVGGSNCLASYVSNRVASCWLPVAAATPVSFTAVRIRGSTGFSATETKTRTEFSISAPNYRSGSEAGGHVLSFTGNGFTAATAITIGGQPCAVSAWSYSSIKCTTPALTGADQAIIATTGGNAHTCIPLMGVARLHSNTDPAGCIYSFVAGSTPSIASAPANMVSNNLLTITGTNFLTTQKPSVKVATSSDNTVYWCRVETFTATEITCRMGVVHAGSYTLSVIFASIGAASNSRAVNADLTYTTQVPSLITGNLGKATLVVTGSGFGADNDGATVALTSGGTAMCDSIWRSDTELRCTTKARDASGAPLQLTIDSKVANGPASFDSAAAHVPTVSSFLPARGGRGTLLSITGTNLGDITGATVGTAACTVQSKSATFATCLITGTVPSGTTVGVSVVSLSRGASAALTGFEGSLAVFHTDPLTAPFYSSTGKVSVPVLGNGFVDNKTLLASVGGAKCDPSNIVGGSFLCNMNASSGDLENHDVAVTIVTGGAGLNSAAIVQYTFSAAGAATVTGITPNFGSAAGMEYITIDGSGFSMTISDMEVRIGSTPCHVIETISTSQFRCITSPMPIQASMPVTVIMANQGKAGGSFTFDSQLMLDTLSTNDVSVEGGLELVINGRGLWNIADSSDWRYSRAIVKIGTRLCKVVSSTKTALRCIVPPTEITPRVKIPTLIAAYALPPEELGRGVTLILNDVAAETSVAVNYRHSATPRVTTVTGDTDIHAGSVVTISGTGFAGSGNVVTYAGAPCPVLTHSATALTCTVTVPGHYSSGAPVRVSVPLKGLSSGSVACSGSGEYLTCDGTCITDANCAYAEWGITTCAALANLIMGDTFCHSNGGTDRTAIPFRSDDGTVINFNCPMYSCEGGDCDQYISIGGMGARYSTCGSSPSGPIKSIKPTVTGIAPSSGSMYGGLLLTIVGSGFPSSNISHATVSAAGVGCTVLSASATSIVCRTGASSKAGSGNVFVYAQRVLAAGTPPAFSVFASTAAGAPLITSLSSTRVSATELITVIGTGFGASAKVRVNGIECTSTTSDASQAVCNGVPHEVGVFGTVNVDVEMPGKGFSNPMSVTKQIRTISVSPSAGSTAGGTLVTVVGSGFSDSLAISFGSCATDFVSFNPSTSALVVRTRPCAVSSVGSPTTTTGSGSIASGCIAGGSCGFAFNAASTPSITSVTPNSLGSGNYELTILLSNQGAGAGSTNIRVSVGGVTCTVTSFSAPTLVASCAQPTAGTYKVLVDVTTLGYAAGGQVFTSLHSISSFSPSTGSVGGGQDITINGAGFSRTASHVKVTVVESGTSTVVPCAVKTSSYSQIVCTTGATTGGVSLTGKINVNIVDGAADSAPVVAVSTGDYVYDASISPTVTSVTPNRGSTAGGTVLTIIGTKLNTAGIAVTIDGVACTQSATQIAAVTATFFSCTTGAHPTTMMTPAKVRVSTASAGDALSTSTYQYVDLWSRFSTWGNSPPPSFGDSVVIGEGTTVMVDYSPPRFNLVIVMGHLIFDPTSDIDFDCTYIMINFGRFTVGTPDAPYLKKATITLHGHRLTPEIPVHGSKVIALRHGALDMHGEKRQPTWTKLAATAEVAASKITVRGPIDWRVGEFLNIASTDFHYDHAEHRMITGVSPSDGQATNVEITLEYPLLHKHFGVQQCFGVDAAMPLCVNEIAEVGLLTRNIVVQGDRDSMNIGFGGTMFLMPMGESAERFARISHVEFRQVGQQFIVGRYPVHYHVTHSSNTSYCNGTSVHESLNRAFSIHGVSNNTYVNNVAYEIQGHAFFIEDGSERWNVIDNNFVCVVHSSTSNLNTDITPANFWIVSPSNKITNNAAGGGDAYGFWISPFHPHSTGPTYSPTICPATHKLWEFHSNTAHSNHKYGFNIFRFWWPKQTECDFNGPDQQAVLHHLTSYKNMVAGVRYGHDEVGQVGSIIWEHIVSADNGMTHPDASAFWVEKIKASNMTNGLRHSLLIARTANDGNIRPNFRNGINLPLGDQFFADNVSFVNYGDGTTDNSHGMEPQRWAERMSLCFPYGWEALLNNLNWVSSTKRVLFRFHHHGILNDLDGSLTGTAKAQLIPKSSIFDETICGSGVTSQTVIPSLICPGSYKVRRFGIGTVSQIFKDQIWSLGSRSEIVPVITRKYVMTAPVHSKVQINFQAVQVPDVWSWLWGGSTFDQPGQKMIWQVRYNETRHHVYANYDGVLDKVYRRPEPTIAGTAANTYSFDNNTYYFNGMIVYPTRTITVSAFNCPDEGCPSPPLPPGAWDKLCKPYHEPSSWLANAVPATTTSTDLMVNSDEALCLGTGFPASECSTGKEYLYEYRNVRLQGTFQFRDEHCPCAGAVVRIRVAGNLWIRQGGLIVGNSTQKLTRCTFRLSFVEPDWDSPEKREPITQRPWGTRSLLHESGLFQLNGKIPDPFYAHLGATAAVGATEIKLDRPALTWSLGDSIVIASTDRREMYTKATPSDDVEKLGMNQRELRKITAISGDRLTLTLDTALVFEHFGSTTTMLDGKKYNVGAEVALLNRNIIIDGNVDGRDTPKYKGGWNLHVGCTPENFEGCSAAPDYGWPMEAQDKPGFLRIEGVWMRSPGQEGLFHAAVELDGLVGNDGSASSSWFRHNVIDGPMNSAIGIRHTTTQMRVEHNVIIDPLGDGINVVGKNNSIVGNLIIGFAVMASCDPTYHIFPDCRVAGIRSRNRNVVADNIVAGHIGAGYIHDGERCDQNVLWSNNMAHSNRDGLLVLQIMHMDKYKWPEPGTDADMATSCRKLGGVITYWNSDHGFATWFPKGGLILENFVSVENAIGISSVLEVSNAIPTGESATVRYRNLVVAGFFDGMKCRTVSPASTESKHFIKCIGSLTDSKMWCDRALTIMGRAKKIGTAGILESVITSIEYGIGKHKGEKKFRWSEVDSYSTLTGSAIHDGIVFANWDGLDECGMRNIAFTNNIFSNDTFKHHIFRNVRWAGTVKNGGEIFATRTYGSALFPTTERLVTVFGDYDNPMYGVYWPDSPNKHLIIDADGTFTGNNVKSAIVADETLVRPTKFEHIGYRGAAFVEGGLPDPAVAGCEFNKDWQMHKCKGTDFEYMSLTIDSLADDTMTRRSGPAVLCDGDGMIARNGWPLCQGGRVQFASGPVPKGKVHRATLDRRTRFKFHALDKSNNTLNFRGEPPAWMRLILHDHEHTAAGSAAGITLNLRFFGLNSKLRMGIYVDGVRQRPSVGFGFPWTFGTSWPGPRDPSGTHFHNKLVGIAPGTDLNDPVAVASPSNIWEWNVMYLTMRPGSVVEIKAESIVQISMDVSVPLDSFFSEKDNFVVALAKVLNIDSTRIKFANVVAGSTASASSSSASSRRSGLALAVAGGSKTAIKVDVSLRDGDAQTSYNTNKQVNDFDSILSSVSSSLTDGTVVNGFSVSNAKAEVLKLVYPIQPINVAYGTPYIKCNTTKGSVNIDQTEMQEGLQKWAKTGYSNASRAPYNVTELDEAGVTNVYHNRETGWSRVVFSFGYENDSYSFAALSELNPLLQSNTTAAKVFPGHQMQQCELVLNGYGVPAKSKLDSNFALIFGLALGLSLFFLIAIGMGTGYYYFYVKPKKQVEKVEKEIEGGLDMKEELGQKSAAPTGDDDYENGMWWDCGDGTKVKVWYNDEGQPYYWKENDDGTKSAHYFYGDGDEAGEAPMFDEAGRQFKYDDDGRPYTMIAGRAEYYYDTNGNVNPLLE